MDGFQYQIDDQVVVALNGARGSVRGLWLDEHRSKLVRVRYVDCAGALHDEWFREDDIRAV